MVQAWYMDNEISDQKLDHHKNPKEFIDLEKLNQITAVEFMKFNPLDYKDDDVLNKLKVERGYTYEDEITFSKECLENYEQDMLNFFTEHLHGAEETRFVLEGTGYFDVRDNNDQWIRIAVAAGDFIIIPSGIYHRFTLDTDNYLKARRYFVDKPAWGAHNRPAEDMECRKQYVEKMKQTIAA